MDDVRWDGLGDDLIEDRLSSPVAPPAGGDGLCLFLLPSSSRSGRHMAEDGGYPRARGDAAAAADTDGFGRDE